MKNFVYLNHKFIEKSSACVNIDTHALHYGTGFFGGIRAYWNKDTKSLFVFRIKDHLKRLKNSAKLLGFKKPDDLDNLKEIVVNLLKKNNYKTGVYIRPIVYVSEETYLAFDLRKLSTTLAITTVPLNHYLNVSSGIKLIVSKWRREPSSAIPPKAKPTGIYLNTALANTEAKAKGYDEALFLTQDGFVSEGSAENIFFLKNKKLYTPDSDSDILLGITRRTVMELATKEFAFKTIEKKISLKELLSADEVFLTGTGAEVTPVTQIDKVKFSGGMPGDFTLKLQKLYFDVVHGKNKRYKKWLTEIKC